MNDLVLNFQDVSFAYPGCAPVLNNLDFQLRRGDRIGVVGHNGSGKTTFFHVVMGLNRPVAGRMEILGRPVVNESDFVAVRQKVGLLFQDPDDQLFNPTVLEDVAFGPLNQGRSPDEAREISSRMLAELGLAGFEERTTSKLSGGEKKLVAMAAILAMEPEILLLDEPVAGLDEKTRARIKEILNKRPALTYILISHEYDFLTSVTETVYLMKEGRLLFDREEALHTHFHVHSFGKYPHQHKA